MTGSKHISDLITDKNELLQGRINIIAANVSAGKTHFALTTIPNWSKPEKILYLIDTTNGEMRIQQNIIAVDRMKYAFFDYNTGHTWGETGVEGKMPVMTYAGFGAEVLKADSKFKWIDYDYIICDEMQNLVNYQHFSDRSTNLEAAERALRTIVDEGLTTVIAMSATPQKIRERFGELCYDVPFDRSNLLQLETAYQIPYSTSIDELLPELKGKTGIVYTTEIRNMKHCIEYAQSIGIRANGFWSASAKTQNDYPFTDEQRSLREIVLSQETIPEDIDLLVINRASETCIKIRADKRPIDFIIVHDCNKEIQTQVRGRYHGDLDTFYYHDSDAANLYQIAQCHIPPRFINQRLYSEDWDSLLSVLKSQMPTMPQFGKPTLWSLLSQCGYTVSEPKKDSKKGGKYYRVLSGKCTILEQLLQSFL